MMPTGADELKFISDLRKENERMKNSLAVIERIVEPWKLNLFIPSRVIKRIRRNVNEGLGK